MFRSIVEDFEAALQPVESGSAARGKAEWERYGNGEERLSVRIRSTDLPDGTAVDVMLRNGLVGRIAVTKGKGELRLESGNQTVPRAGAGDAITLSVNGREILRGTFIPD